MSNEAIEVECPSCHGQCSTIENVLAGLRGHGDPSGACGTCSNTGVVKTVATGTKMTFEEFKAAWSRLTPKQQAWTKAKARWEAMTLWAVMREWSVPADDQLADDGTWCEKAVAP